jgi:hypothetical protein
VIQDDFYHWMINIDGLKVSTASQYVDAVRKLSEHYSMKMGKYFNIYSVRDIEPLEEIANKYRHGIYRDKGYEYHGTNAAAIAKYVKFLTYSNNPGTAEPIRHREPPRSQEALIAKLNDELTASLKKIAELAADRDRLSGIARRLVDERDRALAKARDLEDKLSNRGGGSEGAVRFRRAKVLIAGIHPDKHPTATESERKVRTAIFAELWSEFEKIERH